MISKEMNKLSRRELVDIIYQMKKNEQQMQEEITVLQKTLQDKRIRLSEAGSIAEAALDITKMFSVAQNTADLYLHEIACMKADAENECKKMIEDAKKQAKDILSHGAKKFSALNACYEAEYKKLQMLREEIQELEKRRKQEF